MKWKQVEKDGMRVSAMPHFSLKVFKKSKSKKGTRPFPPDQLVNLMGSSLPYAQHSHHVSRTSAKKFCVGDKKRRNAGHYHMRWVNLSSDAKSDHKHTIITHKRLHMVRRTKAEAAFWGWHPARQDIILSLIAGDVRFSAQRFPEWPLNSLPARRPLRDPRLLTFLFSTLWRVN